MARVAPTGSSWAIVPVTAAVDSETAASAAAAAPAYGTQAPGRPGSRGFSARAEGPALGGGASPAAKATARAEGATAGGDAAVVAAVAAARGASSSRTLVRTAPIRLSISADTVEEARARTSAVPVSVNVSSSRYRPP